MEKLEQKDAQVETSTEKVSEQKDAFSQTNVQPAFSLSLPSSTIATRAVTPRAQSPEEIDDLDKINEIDESMISNNLSNMKFQLNERGINTRNHPDIYSSREDLEKEEKFSSLTFN